MPTIDVNMYIRAATQYTGLDFNSYANFKGKQVAVSSSGVYQVCCGDDDDGTAISGYFSLGKTALGVQQPKVITHAYIMVKSDKDMELDVTVDDKDTVTYSVPVSSTGLQRIRVTFAKGSRGWYWAFKLKNKLGYDFSIDSIQVLPYALAEGVK